MSEQAAEERNPNSPETFSATDFLMTKGVGEFGTAVFQGEVTSQAAERSRLREAEADGNARRRLVLHLVKNDRYVLPKTTDA